ncbi:MAG: SpoIIE family protein phosphatase [Armatimonadota bacterium]
MQLYTGDIALIYTDGATDVKRDGERLEIKGLQRLFLSSIHAPAEQLVGDIFSGICAYGHERLIDDVALVVLKKL